MLKHLKTIDIWLDSYSTPPLKPRKIDLTCTEYINPLLGGVLWLFVSFVAIMWVPHLFSARTYKV